eukprot:365079-Chlamydomonas_euryale.AAC.6
MQPGHTERVQHPLTAPTTVAAWVASSAARRAPRAVPQWHAIDRGRPSSDRLTGGGGAEEEAREGDWGRGKRVAAEALEGAAWGSAGQRALCRRQIKSGGGGVCACVDGRSGGRALRMLGPLGCPGCAQYRCRFRQSRRDLQFGSQRSRGNRDANGSERRRRGAKSAMKAEAGCHTIPVSGGMGLHPGAGRGRTERQGDEVGPPLQQPLCYSNSRSCYSRIRTRRPTGEQSPPRFPRPHGAVPRRAARIRSASDIEAETA